MISLLLLILLLTIALKIPEKYGNWRRFKYLNYREFIYKNSDRIFFLAGRCVTLR
ncbi:MAG: hypothetical protein WBV73_00825 [Phormidium sp.]